MDWKPEESLKTQHTWKITNQLLRGFVVCFLGTATQKSLHHTYAGMPQHNTQSTPDFQATSSLYETSKSQVHLTLLSFIISGCFCWNLWPVPKRLEPQYFKIKFLLSKYTLVFWEVYNHPDLQELLLRWQEKYCWYHSMTFSSTSASFHS